MFHTVMRRWRRTWGLEPVARTPIRRAARPRLGVERFEDRLVPTAASDFLQLQSQLQGFLADVDSGLEAVVSVSKATLPVINKSIGELTGLGNVVEGFAGKLHEAIDKIGNLASSDNLETQAEGLLTQYLGAGGLNILLSSPDVELAESANDELIDVRLHLGKLASEDFTFGLGLASLPFHTDATVALQVGFEIPELRFGLGADGQVFVGKQTDVQIKAEGALTGFNFDAELGFLAVSATANNPASKGAPTYSGFHNAVGLALTVPVLSPQGSPTAISFGTPGLTGGANLDLHLTGGFVEAEVSAPSVLADFVLDWNFLDSQAGHSDRSFGDSLIVGFNNVQVNFGSYLTQMVGPTITKIQEFVEPYKDFFELLAEPIPVISDLAEVIGDTDGVSLLDLAQIANGAGAIPPDYSALVTIASKVVEVTNIINKIKAQTNGSLDTAFLELGNFDVVGNQSPGGGPAPAGKDLREVKPATDAGFGDVTSRDWSDLESIVASIDPEVMREKIATAIGDNALSDALATALDDLVNTLNSQGSQNAAGLKLSFPITDKPIQAVVGMFLGQDTDLVSFEAWANLSGDTTIPVFNYSGFEILLTGGITLEAYLKLGYDTYGLRQLVSKVFNNEIDDVVPVLGDLLNGFYVSLDTKLVLGGEVKIAGGVNWELASAHVVGSLTAGVSVTMPELRADGTAVDLDGDGKIRPYEFHDNLFVVAGILTGSLDLEFKLGVDPLSITESVHIAGGPIASFTTGGTNPFDPGEVVLATRLADGTLRLNVGPHAGARNAPKFAGVKDENVLISQVEAGPGETGTVIAVTMFGLTRRYDQVTSILADAGDGTDVLTVGQSVTVPLTFHGGTGNDRLTTKGSGAATFTGGEGDDKLTAISAAATFDGGAGNDTLTGGTGPSVLSGGDGRDDLIAGTGPSTLNGGAGDDLLVGGPAVNLMYGGDGHDRLVAGPSSGDVLFGGGGDDRFELGAGAATAYGEAGNDEFEWNLVELDGAVKLFGGSGRDIAQITGGAGADTFTVSKAAAGQQADVVVGTPVGVIKLSDVDDIALEAGEGADTITVNDLTGTRVMTVGVNVQELVKSHYGIGDGATDTVVVNATPGNDTVTVTAEPVTVQVPDGTEFPPLTGGLTTFAGLPNYTVKVANVNDAVTFNALGGNDTVTVFGLTGPTLFRGNGGAAAASDDDAFAVVATASKNFVSAVVIDADAGTNSLSVSQPTATGDQFTLTQEQVTGGLFGLVQFTATGGNYKGGVNLATTSGADVVRVRSTLPGVHTVVQSFGGDDTLILSSLDAGGTANLLLGTVTADLGGGSGNLLRLSDAGAAANPNVLVGPNQVAGFAGPSGSTPINFGATGGQLTLQIEGSDTPGVERYAVNKPAAKLRLSTLGGDDTVDVVALDQSAILDLGAGNDLVRLGYGVNKLDGILAGTLVMAGAGADTVQVIDTAGAAGAYALGANSFTRGGVGVTFDGGLETLATFATAAGDTIQVTGVPVAGAVTLDGNGGADTLTGPNADTVWQLTGTNAGTLAGKVAFVEVEGLTGGSGADRFQLTGTTGVTGLILGGTGSDTLDYSAAGGGVTINLATKSAPGTGGFDGIEAFVGGAGADELVGPNLPNLWAVTAVNGGQVGTMAMGTLTFANIESLRGGSSSDSFGFGPNGSLAGWARGEGGTDTLDYSQLPTSGPGVTVNLTTGAATRTGGTSGVENVTGSFGDDLIVGTAAVNVLKGGLGRDVLIGGAAGDFLDGGDGDDLLVGGATSYDADPLALGRVQAEWRSNASYQLRRQRLLGQVGGGANGTTILTDSKLPDDGVADQMTGGVGTDWFWLWGADTSDLNALAGEKNRGQ